MPDVVVTVPKSFGLDVWIAEGDAAGEVWSDKEWVFWTGGGLPGIKPGDRVYVVFNGRLRGYAPLTRLEATRGYRGGRRIGFVRAGGAVACTIDRPIPGFRGWRYRDWDYIEEKPFPEWRTP